MIAPKGTARVWEALSTVARPRSPQSTITLILLSMARLHLHLCQALELSIPESIINYSHFALGSPHAMYYPKCVEARGRVETILEKYGL